MSLSGSAVDDPDQIFYESYVCKSPRNYSGYCNPEVETLIDQQSIESDPEKRKQIVWQIERKMVEDVGSPGDLPHACCDLLAAAGQEPDPTGQQRL